MTLLIEQQVALGDVIEYTANAPSLAQYLLISNDSQYELTWFYDGNAGESRSLPPYTEVQNEIPIGAAETVRGGSGTWHGKIILRTALVPGTIEDPSPPARVLRVEGFAHPLAGERRTVRDVAQGSLIVGVAQQMQGAGQAIAVTELDSGASPAIVPATGTNVPLILSARDAAGAKKDVVSLDAVSGLTILAGGLIDAIANAGIELGSLSVANTPFVDLHTNGNFDFNARIIAQGGGAALGDATLRFSCAALIFDGPVTQLAGKTLVGALGVPGLVGTNTKPVTVTTLQNGATYTAGATDEDVLILANVLVANGVSGNLIVLKVIFTDVSNTPRTTFFALNGGGGVTNTIGATGANSIANAYWPAESISLRIKASSTVTVQYQDPTNTPNDVLTSHIIRIN